ncbi:hypothetical protein GOODEAATRI_010906 [Goodea atripinnis]|uniref:Uncharacterized protein n=1 Tax=Goodea atripinnis TaxID=208336 RepID=A0ABV0PD25_9TELE
MVNRLNLYSAIPVIPHTHIHTLTHRSVGSLRLSAFPKGTSTCGSFLLYEETPIFHICLRISKVLGFHKVHLSSVLDHSNSFFSLKPIKSFLGYVFGTVVLLGNPDLFHLQILIKNVLIGSPFILPSVT